MQSTTLSKWPGLSYGALPLTIMILVVIACLIGFSLATANLEGSRGRAINRNFRENQLRFDASIDSYAHLLWGITGRLQSGDMDDDQWKQFVSVYNLKENFTGVEAVGVAYGTSPTDVSIKYVAPQTDVTNKTVGTNIGSIPQLAATMRSAAQTGQTTISDALPSLYTTKPNESADRPGFLAFAPFYDTSKPLSTADERLDALKGYSIALFRGDIFFAGTFKDFDMSHVKIDAYLGEQKPEDLIYSGGKTTTHDRRVAVQKVTEYGKTFTLVYTLDTNYILVWSLTYFPQFLLFGGLLLGVLFAGISGYMLRDRYRRLIYEKERDVNFAKDELLSLASHQLRTPATGVKQYLGMVLQGFAGDLSEKQRDYIERAYASNNRQLHVINDILHMAKIETGRIVLAERKFDIAKMVREVIDEQRDQAEKGEVALHLSTPPTGMIVGDSHMLWMVVENLVSNAIKYTPAGGVVTIRLVRRGKRWVLSVKDTGVGIAKSDFSKLFKQFSRINNARSEVVTGTGVGLYLAHHLTVLHGGTIGVTSIKDKGTTFTVRLPRKM